MGIALPAAASVLVHLQNSVIREGTSGETSTIPLVAGRNDALHSYVREYPSQSRDKYAAKNCILGPLFLALGQAQRALGSSVARIAPAASLVAAAAMAAAAGKEMAAAAACTCTAATGQLR